MRNSSTILHAREADTLPVFVASEAIMELPTRVIRSLRLPNFIFPCRDRVFGRDRVVLDVLSQGPAQRTLADKDQSRQAFCFHRPHPALGERI
jgi:hypothetical protein